MHTPWGQSQQIEEIATGIRSISTARHGGYQLSAARQAQLPAHSGDRNFNKGLTWWEEDCDWCVPFLVFRHEFRSYYDRNGMDHLFALSLDGALKAAENYHPEFFAVFTSNAVIQPTLFSEVI